MPTVEERDERSAVARSRRVVIKIGSRTLAAEGAHIFEQLASVIAAHRKTTFVVVSSGAIALGVKKLGYRARPKEMAKLQAAAAAGQSLLMRAYEEAFGERGLPVAQVLLTHADLADRTRATTRGRRSARSSRRGDPHPQRERLGRGRRDQVRRQRSARGDGGAARRRRSRAAPQRRRGAARRRGPAHPDRARRGPRGPAARSQVDEHGRDRGDGEQGRGRATGDARRGATWSSPTHARPASCDAILAGDDVGHAVRRRRAIA